MSDILAYIMLYTAWTSHKLRICLGSGILYLLQVVMLLFFFFFWFYTGRMFHLLGKAEEGEMYLNVMFLFC